MIHKLSPFGRTGQAHRPWRDGVGCRFASMWLQRTSGYRPCPHTPHMHCGGTEESGDAGRQEPRAPRLQGVTAPWWLVLNGWS